MKTELSKKWLVCRVCLKIPSDTDELLQDIFSQNASTRLDQMLHICAGIPVSVDDNFPDQMCSKCVRVLRVAYKFRLTCQRSQQHIADMINTSLGVVEDEDTETEAIARAWEESTSQVSEHTEAGEFVSYEVSGEDEEDDTILYDATTADEDQNDVIFEDTEIEAETETEQFQDYEELEVFTTETLSSPNNNTESTTSNKRGSRPVLWSEVPDNEEEILSPDEDSLLPQIKPQPRLLNNVRPPRKTQQRPKATGTQIIALSGEKKMGRRPRDKHSNYICDVCGNIFPSQGRLTEHMKFHSGAKHECEICGRGFVQNQQLVRHMNTHTGNRPYKCNFCPAAFADRSTKTKHHRIHTKERPYECDVCFKTFTYSDNLKFHKMLHTGEKPHVCDICGKGFVRAYKMRRHRVTHEKRGPWKPVQLEIERDEERMKNDLHEVEMVISMLPSS